MTTPNQYQDFEQRPGGCFMRLTNGVRDGWAAMVIALAGLLTGCTLVTPARFDRVPPRDMGPGLSQGEFPATPVMPLTGRYEVTIVTHWTGPVHGRLLAEPTVDGFRANTPPGVAWSLVGGIRGSLGSIFVPFIFPSGMILTWTSTVPTADSPGVGSIGFGTRSSMRLETRIASPGGPVELIMKDGRVVGTLTLSRTSPGDESSTDHLALVQDMERVIHASLYDPQQADTSDMRSYLADLREGAAKVHDDIEFLLVEALTARAFPKLVAGFLYPRPDQQEELAMSGIANPVTPYQVKRDEGTTTIRFDAILDEDEVDEAFELALKDSPEAVILDLRKAAGLDVGALRILSWIARSPVNVGLFVGRADRVAVLNGALPATLTLDSAQDFEDLRSSLGAGQSADVWVTPRPVAFHGPVAVLIAKRASGSTEAAIAAIRTAMIAPTFGEATAGKPLVSYEFDVGTPDPRGQAWVTHLPVAEYVPPDRRSIMESGVEPDVAVRGNALVEAATRWIGERLNDHTWDADAWFETDLQ